MGMTYGAYDKAEKVATKTFTQRLVSHGSWGSSDQGMHESTMDMYMTSPDTGLIEWDIPSLEEFESIGLEFGLGFGGTVELTSYDGIMALPKEAIEMIESVGIRVGDDFR